MTAASDESVLTAVIPALDEEQAIGDTIQRCLDAREQICAEGGIDDVEIIVVSDGSTDRTVEIARGFDDVQVIVFEVNRGYGAAIQEGFRRGRGNLVGFLDADGTCDPRTFGPLCHAAVHEGGDVVLGSRLGPGSKMPAIRRFGNRIYAIILGLLCGRWVTDTASGMRVIRRSALARLYPLPEGLHFTPAMSARALLNGLSVVEIPMAYEERIGESKLSVFGDGVRFLRVIIEGVLCYRPERLFLLGFTLCLAIGGLLAAYPVEYYLKNASVQEGMVYRFLVCFLLGSTGFLMLCGAALANRMAMLRPFRQADQTFWASTVSALFEGRVLGVFVAAAVLGSLALLWPGMVEWLRTGQILDSTLHWSRMIVGIFGLLLAVQALLTGVLLRVLSIWRDQQALRAPAHVTDRRRRDAARES